MLQYYWPSWLGFHLSFPHYTSPVTNGNGAKVLQMVLKCVETRKHRFVGGTEAPIRYGDGVSAPFRVDLPYNLNPDRGF